MTRHQVMHEKGSKSGTRMPRAGSRRPAELETGTGDVQSPARLPAALALSGGVGRPAAVIDLQKRIGNRAVQRLVPPKATVPVQRRAFTNQEHAIGQHINDVAAGAETEATDEPLAVRCTTTTTGRQCWSQDYTGPDVARRLRVFKEDLASQIRAVPRGTDDPDWLLATLWTLHVWRTAPSSYAQSRALSSHLPVRDLGASDYKCNRFAADAYAVGASKGYAPHGAGGAYPTGTSPFWDPRSAYPPSANELGSSGPARGTLAHLRPVSTSRTGDIIAFPYDQGIGHSGINLGHGLYISARHDEKRPAKRIQVEDGIQITTIRHAFRERPQYRRFT